MIADEQQQLPAAREAERAPVAELDEVVEEADRAAAERDAEDRERRDRVVAEEQERDDGTDSISSPPIVGVPCFTCGRRALLADVLPELAVAQEVDELRPGHDRDDHRDDAGER